MCISDVDVGRMTSVLAQLCAGVLTRLALMAGVLPSEDTVVRGRFLNSVAIHTLFGWRLIAPPWLVATPWTSC